MDKLLFPKDFLWGASTSAHQVEGNNIHNDWWRWEQTGRTVPSGAACDHYTRFREDFDIAKSLGHNTHRFGIEWARVQKAPGTWDEAEWGHYRNVTDELLRRGILPIPTLNHFTIPAWLEDMGGWANDKSADLFADLAVKALEVLGDKVEYWITINEPHMLAFIGFFYGSWPPYRKDPDEAFHILKNLLKGHVKAYSRMHREAAANPAGIIKPKIGIAHAVAALHPASRLSIKDISSAEKRDFAHNHSFITSCIDGEISIPGIKSEKLESRSALDFIGLNYYYRQFIWHKTVFPLDPLGGIAPHNPKKRTGAITDMGWETYPRGIYELVKKFSKYGLPIMITENGLATTDDAVRKEYIRTHLEYLSKAVREGCPVTGYLHWSLIDNFEWAEAYTKKFGLVGVDFKTQERKVRDSARYYASIIEKNSI